MKLTDIVSEYFTGSETRKIYDEYRSIVKDIYENYIAAQNESYKWEKLDVGLSKKVPNYLSGLGFGLGILGFWPVAGLVVIGSECLRNISSFNFMLIRKKIFVELEQISSELVEEHYQKKVEFEEKQRKEEQFPFDTSGYDNWLNPEDNYD